MVRHRLETLLQINCGNGLWDIHPKISKLIEEFNPEFLRLDEI